MKRILLMAVPALLSCRGPGDAAASHSVFDTRTTDTNLRVALVAPQLSFARGDTVRFWAFLVNRGAPRTLDNHPVQHSVSVSTRLGEELAPIPQGPVAEFLGTDPIFTLPADAAIGELISLPCVNNHYAAVGSRDACYYTYDLSQAGEYWIRVSYAVPPRGSTLAAPTYRLPADAYEIVSDSILVTIR